MAVSAGHYYRPKRKGTRSLRVTQAIPDHTFFPRTHATWRAVDDPRILAKRLVMATTLGREPDIAVRFSVDAGIEAGYSDSAGPAASISLWEIM
jgi:hypothetical protein